MRSRAVRTGRTFVVTFDHGEDFFAALGEFCRAENIRQGYLPMFIAGFRCVDIVGACDRVDDPEAPIWSKVHLRNVEAVGAGTLAWDPDTKRVLPHIHCSVGVKEHSATGHTSHLLAATVQFLTELVVVEITEPDIRRIRDPELYDVPLLRLDER
ncbi:MAG: DUF296 domain-containing protein [Micromonosporaceae bacterium]|nr:DUF296 domain-containing protein [Micromonosporaceae bacterium]